MTLERRPIEVFSLSFLDVISCGFGAIILLLVLSLVLEPATREELRSELSGEVARIEDERREIITESRTLQESLSEKQSSLAVVKDNLGELESQLQDAEKASAEVKSDAQKRVKEELQSVRQRLSKEMKNLLSKETHDAPSSDSVIGGIPVDSEYIVFVIDTSGSMGTVWSMVLKKVEEVLSVYPHVKGVQVVDDMGQYMFSSYAGRWIPDSPARRRAIVDRLRGWLMQTKSDSNPKQGIIKVVRLPTPKDAQMSVYVFGDDFKGGSFEAVIGEVARINKKDASGKTRVRIHAFGFPTGSGSKRFAHLMRLLAEQNSGSFVGLTELIR